MISSSNLQISLSSNLRHLQVKASLQLCSCPLGLTCRYNSTPDLSGSAENTQSVQPQAHLFLPLPAWTPLTLSSCHCTYCSQKAPLEAENPLSGLWRAPLGCCSLPVHIHSGSSVTTAGGPAIPVLAWLWEDSGGKVVLCFNNKDKRLGVHRAVHAHIQLNSS